MFKYQSLDISDFSGGLTDNYKTSSKAKFNVLKNFINSDNRSIRVRDGVAPLSEVGTSPIRDISVLGNKTILSLKQLKRKIATLNGFTVMAKNTVLLL